MSPDRTPGVKRAGWSFADQGVVSLGNFLTQIVLVRILAPGDYGIFVLIYTVMLLLNSCHSAVVTYPLSVHGAMSDGDGLRKLTTSSLALTVVALAAEAPVVLATAIFLKHEELAIAILVALFCWQLQETMRRGLMAHLRHRGSLPGDALSYCGQAAVLWLLSRHGPPSLTVIFEVIAATSLVALALQAAQLRPVPGALREALGLLPSYWRLGKWNMFSGGTDVATNGTFPWMLDLAEGAPAAASFQAASNLLRLSHPILFGVGNWIVPAASVAGREGSVRRAVKAAMKPGALGALLLLPYFAFLLLWPRLALSLAYGHGSAYVALGTPLRWFVLYYVFTYICTVLGAFLNGIGHPSTLLAAEIAGAVCALAAGIPLTLGYGVLGACIGSFLVALVRATAGSLLVWRLLRTNPAGLGRLAQGLGQ